MIRIRTLNKAQLTAFVSDGAFEKLPFLPISRHRAASHIANPRAEDEDILLLLAYEDESLAGYLGVLPDRMFIGDKEERCGWLSCIYVDEAHRGKRIAQQMLEQCYEVWDNRILMTGYTAEAKRIYDRSGKFRALAEPTGIRVYMRADLSTLLPPKGELFRKNAEALKSLDAGINAVMDLRLPSATLPEGITLEHVKEVDDEIEAFILPRMENQLLKRGKAELNWMLEHPWVISAPEDVLSKRYHFSSVDKVFAFYPIKVRNSDGKLKAFIILAQRNDSLKLPYCYHDGDIATVWNAVRSEMLRLRSSTFTTFQPELSEHIRKTDRLSIHRKSIQGSYLVAKRFDAFLGNSPFALQDGDADCAFT